MVKFSECANSFLVYKTFQAAGGAVAWRINALKCTFIFRWFKRPPLTECVDPALVQLTINWALLGGALLIAIPTVLSITPSPVAESDVQDDSEKTRPVDDEKGEDR
jgi:hypothetical protein